MKITSDTYFARQLVVERLATAKERIPNGLGSPEVGPITTGLGQIYKYILTSPTLDPMELRSINDSLVKFQLRTVPGVTDVLSFGGDVRQYQVRVNPNRLVGYNLSLADLRTALKGNNTNAGGWYLEGSQEQLVVRGEGLIRGGREGLLDIENIVLKSENGVPVYVRDVADVEYGAEIRQGAVSKDGNGEVVMGVVLQLKGANTNTVIAGLRKKVEAVQKVLPEGVKIEPVYDQSDLIEKAVDTVIKALTEAAVLIVIVLFLFLWNIRSALVVLVSIPLSMLVAVIMMRWYGLSANLQSLGGLAIGIGMMVDGSLVMVENIMRHLSEPDQKATPLAYRVVHAAQEVAQPIFFAVLIIIVVFLPLFTLQGVEGKLFSPMAFVVAFAMLGSLVVALTIVPVLSSIVFTGKMSEDDSFLVRGLKYVYRSRGLWPSGRWECPFPCDCARWCRRRLAGRNWKTDQCHGPRSGGPVAWLDLGRTWHRPAEKSRTGAGWRPGRHGPDAADQGRSGSRGTAQSGQAGRACARPAQRLNAGDLFLAPARGRGSSRRDPRWPARRKPACPCSTTISCRLTAATMPAGNPATPTALRGWSGSTPFR